MNDCSKLFEGGYLYKNLPKGIKADYIVFGTENYYFKVRESSFRYGIIAVIIVFVIIVFLFIVFLFYEEKEIRKFERTQNNQNNEKESEELEDEYINVGNSECLDLNIISVNKVENIEKCKELCDNNSSCNGIKWKNKKCTLFNSGLVKENKSLSLDDTESSIYLKNIFSIQYMDRIFLFENNIKGDYHYLRRKNLKNNSHITIFLNKVYQLNFFPTFSINNTNSIGIYSLYSFNEEQYQDILNIGNTKFTTIVNDKINIPIEWYGLPIWVMYL